MYIQNNNGDLPFTVPRGYSGNAFAPPQGPEPPPEVEEAAPDAPQEMQNESETVQKNEEAAAPAFASHRDGHKSGLLERLPFLSSLLPPPRKGRGEKEGLPEWVVIGIVLLLLLDSPENDLLPFLLILLLWD